MRLSSAEDVARVLAEDARFQYWKVHGRGAGWIEVRRDDVILVLCWPECWRDPAAFDPHLTRARTGNYSLVLLGSDDEFVAGHVDQIRDAPDLITVHTPVPAERLLVAMNTRGETTRLRIAKAALELDLERAQYENQLLISIGRALSQQRDIDSLLALILRRARDVTGADAGSVYIVEGDADELTKRTLRFTVSQNDSIALESTGFTLPVSSSSIVGMCVLSADVINIPDLYRLDKPGTGNNPWGFAHDRSFDDKHHYQTRSMLTVPMISAREQVIGVIQLINKRARGFMTLRDQADFDKGVVPFDDVSVNYAATLASQAGIALENALLYDEVKTLFEGFVRASVIAIEARDPTTSGHSGRVADLTVGLAKVVDRTDSGPYAGTKFDLDQLKEMEWAGLLHDFGKVGVREHVLVKAKKLYPHQRELILQRFQFIRRSLEVEQYKAKVKHLVEASREQVAEVLAEVDRDSEKRLAELDDFLQFILKANEPTVLEQGGFERLADIAQRRFFDLQGAEQPYLCADEVTALQVARGSLTEGERKEIESHVVHTYNFLRQIPWGRTYRNIPEIAGAHHEKLNGRGYPSARPGPAIPIETRMMTISDIYDALTASDRPYKKAVPVPKALDIIGAEVKQGLLDADLYQLFVDAKVWELTVKPT
jgi:HD-GYP domain-containing protein (c-di-GMP phosphodiesterase class II)